MIVNSIVSRALVAACLCGGLSGGAAASAAPFAPPTPPAQAEDYGVHANEMRARARRARAERAYADIQEAAKDLHDLSDEIVAHFASRGSLSDDDAKSLDRVRKLAKKVRTGLGGSGDPQPLEAPPAASKEAVDLLGARAKSLQERLNRASRFEANTQVIVLAGEVMALADTIRALEAGAKR